MKNLYQKYLSNFLFERKFLYRGGPKGAPGGAPSKGPKGSAEAPTPPTINDVKDRIQHIRDNLNKIKNPKNKTKLESHLKRIERTMDRVKQSKTLSEKLKKSLIKRTYEALKKKMEQHGIKEKQVPRPQFTNPNFIVQYPKGISGKRAKLKPGSKVEKKEVESKYEVSVGDVVNHKIKVLQGHLDNFVQGMKKRTKLSTAQVKSSSEYKEISKVIKESQTQVSKIQKMKIKIPGIYDRDIGKARAKLKSLKSKKPVNKQEVGIAEVNLQSELDLKNSYSYNKKEAEYKKVNAKIKAVAKKYNVDVPAYKPPTTKLVLALIKNMRDNLKNVKDPKQKKIIAATLRSEEALTRKIDKNTTGEEKQKMLTDQSNMLKKWQKQRNLQYDPFHKGITGPTRTAKAKTSLKAKPSAAVSKGIKAPGRVELKEITPDYKKRLIKNLRHLENGTIPNFRDAKREIMADLGRTGLSPGSAVNKVISDTTSLPDGYEVGMINWGKAKNGTYENYPSLVIYRHGKVVCYRTGTRETGYNLRTPEEGGNPDHLKAVQIIKAHSVINKFKSNLTKIGEGKNLKLKISNQGQMDQIKTSLRDFAKNANMPASARTGYAMVINSGGTLVYFKNSGGGHGEFKIVAGAETYFFNTRGDRIGIAKFGPKGKKVVDKYSGELGVMTVDEQKNIGKAKEKKAAKERFDKNRKELKDHLNPAYKNLIQYDSKDPNSFTVGKDKPNRAERKLLNKSINSVINFKKVTDKFVYITIKGAKGKRERKALYIPGAKTAYVLDKRGKMTRKRVKFYNGDKFKVEFKTPTTEDFGRLRNKDRIVAQEKMKALTKLKKLKTVSDKFKALKGKAGDISKENQAKIKKLRKYNIRLKDVVEGKLAGRSIDYHVNNPKQLLRGRKAFIKIAEVLIPVLEEANKNKTQKPKSSKG